jgi:hypothetical protein
MNMTATIILWAILAFPLVLGILFRVGAPHLFFSLMAGELLARYFGHDVEKLTADNIAATSPDKYGEILLIFAAMILTAFFMRGTISKSRIALHVLPLAITGIIMAAFVLPLLPAGIQSDINNTFVGGWILNLNRSIVGIVVVVQLVSLWLFNRSEKHKKNNKN